jgi:hypothetical protein
MLMLRFRRILGGVQLEWFCGMIKGYFWEQKLLDTLFDWMH